MKDCLPKKGLEVYWVDAFTREAFSGNRAVVCLLDHWREDRLLQAIAAELNVAETAFVRPVPNEATVYDLRWFSPLKEMPLCGHATLAASKVLFGGLPRGAGEITYRTAAGILSARRNGTGVTMDFPADPFDDVLPPPGLPEALRLRHWTRVIRGRNTGKWVFHLPDAAAVRSLQPDLMSLRNLRVAAEVKGVGVTAAGDQGYDCVSRYFNPWAGVDEDPVTGSVHTVLATYWANLLQKNTLKAFQASERGGELLLCLRDEGRLDITGEAVIVCRGEMHV